MLISMFHYLRKILSETIFIAKGVEKIQDNQENGVELISIMSSKQSTDSKPVASSSSSTPSSKKTDTSYCHGVG
jgi:hypothetical protein